MSRHLLWLAPMVLWNCIPSPEWKPIPHQLPSVTGPDVPEVFTFARMNDPRADDVIVKDVIPGGDGDQWRWTAQNPIFQFVLPDAQPWRLRLKGAVPEASFKVTGPVNIDIHVNDRRIGAERVDKPGTIMFEWPVPSALVRSGRVNTARFHIDKVFLTEPDKMKLGFIVESVGFVH